MNEKLSFENKTEMPFWLGPYKKRLDELKADFDEEKMSNLFYEFNIEIDAKRKQSERFNENSPKYRELSGINVLNISYITADPDKLDVDELAAAIEENARIDLENEILKRKIREVEKEEILKNGVR